MRVLIDRTKRGIRKWAVKKKKTMGKGFLTASTISRALSFKAPERVIQPKSQGIKGLSPMKKEGSKTPNATPKGAKTGINLSIKRFKLIAVTANPVNFLDWIWLVGIRYYYNLIVCPL
jgi:hypothetical protein